MSESKRREQEALVQAAVNNSPYYRHVGMRVIGYTESGSVMEVTVRPEHKNVWGTMHGGVLASLVDSCCGTAIGPALGGDETAVTLDVRVQFFRPVREGTLTAKGRMVHRTQRYAIAEAEVHDQEGNLVARGSTIHSVVRRKGAGLTATP